MTDNKQSSPSSVDTNAILIQMMQQMKFQQDHTQQLLDQQQQLIARIISQHRPSSPMLEREFSVQAGEGTLTQQSQRPLPVLKPRANALLLRAGPNEPKWSHWVEWRAEWDDFVILNESTFQKADWKQKRAALRAHFTPEFKKVFEEAIEGSFSPNTAGEPSITEYLSAIEKYVKDMRNLMIDRRDFFSRKQKRGETFEQFLVELKTLSKQAEACEKCLGCTLTTLITLGVEDASLQRKLLEMRPEPTLQEVIDKCRAWEAAVSASRHAQSSSMNAVKKIDSTESPNSKTRDRNRSKLRSRVNRCGYCGKDAHERRDDCPAKDKVCSSCSKMGHFAHVCRYRKKTGKNVGIVKVQTAEVLDTPWDRSIKVTIYPENKGTKATFTVNPDTGSQIDLIPVHFLKYLRLRSHELSGTSVKLASFIGEETYPKGCFTATVSVGSGNDEASTQTKFFVVDGAKELLISGKTAERLGIVSFPRHQNVGTLSVVANELPQFSQTPTDVPTNSVAEAREYLLQKYQDVFDNSIELKPMKGEPMRIHVSNNARPFAHTAARQIAHGLRDLTKQELELMVQKGIIEPVGDERTEWCSPLVVVKHSTGKIRICVDFTKLNSSVSRPYYPLRTPADAVAGIKSTDKFFAVMDAVKGYWQIQLDPRDKHFTTFITPYGRYRFLRSPMGLSCSGDEYCRRGDIAMQKLQNVEKVVDDILVHNDSLEQHVKDVEAVLKRCREYGITLNREKFKFGEKEVDFVGYHLSSKGIAVDTKKIKAIQDFPQPTNISELRSFFGLVNQLGAFSKDIAHLAGPLRPLLKAKNAFVWLPSHIDAFTNLKEALVSPPILQPFDVKCETFLMTDASRTRGLGYALMQKRTNGEMVLIQCGSRFITETERRYAMVELELLAVVWAMNKCKVYLIGLNNFTLIVDHNPLVPILNSKGIDEIDNPRILRLKEKHFSFKFRTEWRKGKDHAIPDALSRSPVDDPDADDFALEEELTEHLEYRINALMLGDIEDSDGGLSDVDNTRDIILEQITEATRLDEDFQQLRKLMTSGFEGIRKSTDLPIQLRPFYKIRDDLSEVNGLLLHRNRILIPMSKRRTMLERLHSSHQGIVRTLKRARACVFWPGISSDIKNIVDTCDACQENRPSLAPESLQSDPKPTRAFQETAADLCEYGGRQYLVYVDRYSGWIEVRRFGSHPDSDGIIETLMDLFAKFGAPQKFRSDGGPQFSSAKTRDFCSRWGVRQVFSAPHYPQSNGLAEAAVKSVKKLLEKSRSSEEFYLGLLELRNTPGLDNMSPAQKLFGKGTRSVVPSMTVAPNTEAALSPDTLEPPRRDHRPIQPGDQVRLQNPRTKKWDRLATVLKRDGRNYVVRSNDHGKELLRNRQHLIPCRKPPLEQPTLKAPKALRGEPLEPTDNKSTPRKTVRFDLPAIRRSERLQKKFKS